jgi:thiamine-monophosphate kinase
MYDEFELIDRIAALFATPEGLTLGIGDDCAILDPGRFDLVTTDTLVEGVHFETGWSSPADIGWKSVAVSMSDIAAMGGGPGAFFLNLSLGPDADEMFVDGLLNGMKAACDELTPDSFEVAVGGGDVTSSPGPTVITVTLLGEASPAGPVTRSGALPGDRIALLGPTGAAAAGLSLLRGELDAAPDSYPALVEAHCRPRPRVKEGALLGLYGVPSALIDVSDGLVQDLGHILERSGVGATLETHNVPRHPELARLADNANVDVLPWILGGGDDYELIIIVPPARMTKLWDLARRHDWDVLDIGEIRSPEEGMRVLAPDGTPIEPSTLGGFRHFGES